MISFKQAFLRCNNNNNRIRTNLCTNLPCNRLRVLATCNYLLSIYSFINPSRIQQANSLPDE
jgi:hypothetical protein